MRVLLLVPDFARSNTFLQPPLCLYGIAANLGSSYQISILDNRVERKAVHELKIFTTNADVIVVSTSPYDITQMYHFDYRLQYSIFTVNAIKKQNAHAHITIVGAHATVFSNILLQECDADSVVCGEVELTVPLLLEAIRTKQELSIVPNIYYKYDDEIKQSYVEECVSAPSFCDFNDTPAWHLASFQSYFGYQLNMDGHYERLSGWGVILGSRGCSYSCSFCYNFWGKTVRHRNPMSVFREYQYLSGRKDINRLFFLDPNFTVNRQWCLDLCELLQSASIRVPWICQTRCDLVDNELLISMKKAGCITIQYGVETFNNDILDIIGKGITVNKVENAIAITKAAGITPGCFLMLGLPNETLETMNRTIHCLQKEKLPFIPILYSPRWGSPDADILFGTNSKRHWETLLPARGKRSDQFDTINLVSNFSKLRGESFKMTNASLNRSPAVSRSHHRSHFNNSLQISKQRDVSEYVLQTIDKDYVVPFISIPITGKCNLKCLYCGTGGENTICADQNEFALMDFVEYVMMAKRNGVKKVRITGGEPFLNQNFGEMIRFLADSEMDVLVNTNGTLVCKNIDWLFRPNKNLHFAVSLDTVNPDTFEKLNNSPRQFLADAIEGIRTLKELGLLMRINTVVTKLNVHEIGDIVDFCAELDCDLKLQEVASVPAPFGNWNTIHQAMDGVENEIRESASEVLVHTYARYYGIPVPIYKVKGIHVTVKNLKRGGRYDNDGICRNCTHLPCHEGLYDIFLLNNGAIAPCRWTLRAGDVEDFEDRLKLVINGFRQSKYSGKHSLLMPMTSWASK